MNALYTYAERLMGMSDTVWERHANPLSVYSRFTALPLLALAIWSRDWIGGWAWLFVALAVVWIWLNPRLFPPPRDLDSWASRGVLGERVFLNHPDQVASHHHRWAKILSIGALPGAIVMGVGLWRLNAGWVVFGTALTMLPKIWFVDRMVWVYADWLLVQEKELGDV